MTTVVRIPRKATSTAWYDVLKAHEQIVTAPGEITLDASATDWVEPFGATVLALAVARRRLQGMPAVSWVPPRAAACASFLEEIAFPLYLTGTPEERDAAAWHDTLEMRQVAHLDPTYLADVAELIARLVPGTTEDTSHLVRLCLSELVTNVRDHASSPVGCFILARWYKEKGNVRIAIADAGDTIPGVLSAHEPYAGRSDQELLQAAVMTAGVTSRTPRKGGRGLKTLRDITTQRAGGLIVVSGRAKFDVRGPANPPRESPRGLPTRFAGTAIEIDFRPLAESPSGEDEVF